MRELVWGFVDTSNNQGANDVHGETATTTTSISQTTTDWVRENVPSDNIVFTVSPIMDVVAEHIERVEVNISKSTTFPSEEIGEISTVINEQLSEGTSLKTTSTTKFSTITSPPPTTTTTETDGAITWDYRLLGVDASFDMEDLHWSYFLLMGNLLLVIHHLLSDITIFWALDVRCCDNCTRVLTKTTNFSSSISTQLILIIITKTFASDENDPSVDFKGNKVVSRYRQRVIEMKMVIV